MCQAPQLYPFQAEGVKHLLRRRCVLLADEMGLGKTVQAAVAIDQLFEGNSIRRALIVCPASLSRNWRHEIHQWSPRTPVVLYEGADRYGMLEGNIPVLVGSYETIAGDLRRFTRDGTFHYDIGIDLLVLDEAQRIKDPGSLKSKVFSRLLAPRRWAITGTPLENHPRELASILRFLFPNEFATKEAIDDPALTLSLKDTSIVRRIKSQVGAQLPSKTVSYVPLALSPEQGAEYAQACDEIAQTVRNAVSLASASATLLGGLQTLRRLAVLSSSGDSAKIDFLTEEVEDLAEQGEKIVVFSSFANLVLPTVASRLREYGSLLYTGEMSAEEREVVHNRFLHDPSSRVMCASLKAAGVGLTWTVAAYVYHLDIWWNPQVLRQAEDRVHRIGQKNPVLVKRLISEGTIEEGIRELLAAKEEIFDLVITEKADNPSDPKFLPQLLSLIGLKMSDLRCSRRRRK